MVLGAVRGAPATAESRTDHFSDHFSDPHFLGEKIAVLIWGQKHCCGYTEVMKYVVGTL